MITPEDPREPYIAAAEPSLRTFIDSISLGSTLSRDAPTTPSTTTRGEIFAPTVERPLKRIVAEAFGFPPLLYILNPATFP